MWHLKKKCYYLVEQYTDICRPIVLCLTCFVYVMFVCGTVKADKRWKKLAPRR